MLRDEIWNWRDMGLQWGTIFMPNFGLEALASRGRRELYQAPWYKARTGGPKDADGRTWADALRDELLLQIGALKEREVKAKVKLEKALRQILVYNTVNRPFKRYRGGGDEISTMAWRRASSPAWPSRHSTRPF